MTYRPNTLSGADLLPEAFPIAITLACVPFVPLTRSQRADYIGAKLDASVAAWHALQVELQAQAEQDDIYLAWCDDQAQAQDDEREFPNESGPGNPLNY